MEEMARVGFLHPDHAPTPEAQLSFPNDLPLASSEARDKLVSSSNIPR